MIVDTHCHYNLKPLSNDIAAHWKKAQDSGIEAAINVGTDLETSKSALKIASEFPDMYASIGLHPGNYTQIIKEFLVGDKYSQDEIDKFVDTELQKLSEILETELKNKDSKLVAIGEIGLDYYRLKTKGLKRELVVEMQKKAFEKQLELAFKNNLPVILHVRDQNDRLENNAYYDTLEILKRAIEDAKTADLVGDKTTPKFVLHCISGPQAYVKEAISLGAYIGVAGNITYDNAQELREIVKMVPEEKLLVETDAPYLVPKGFDSEVCEPYMIKKTADFLHREMRINLDIIRGNTNNLFFK